MLSDGIVLRLDNVSKCYHIYQEKHHRLLQTLFRGRKTFYREFWALRDITFETRRGECLGIIGRNGAGKSTLLQIIAGTLAPSVGNMEVKGKIAALLELGSGFNPEFTGRENVFLNGAVLGLSVRKVKEKFDEIADFAEIGDFMEQPVKTYSSGMKMRLAFAIQALLEPEILIVDEALSVGDGAFQIKCMNRMRELIKNGTTVLFVSHSMQTVQMFCSRVVWLHDGKIRKMGDTKEITTEYNEMLYDVGKIRPSLRSSENASVALDETEGAEFPVTPLEEAPRPGKLRRWGTGAVQVQAFSLRGLVSGSAISYQYGEELVLCVEAEVKEGFQGEKLSVAFAIRNRQGLDVLSIGSDRLGAFSNARYPGDKVRVRFKFNNEIIPGDYALILAMIYYEDGKRIYADYVENAHHFSILSDRLHCGLFEPLSTVEFIQ